jgi:serine/threonine-protein kinase RsbT
MNGAAGGVVQVVLESDIAAAMRLARRVARKLGFSETQTGYVATAASELAANLFVHGGGGVFAVGILDSAKGLELSTQDNGPGIADIKAALKEGYSTTGGLGCGLPGVQRLMDSLDIDSAPGRGTRVRACKWR